MSATGTLMRNTERQLNQPTARPPMVGPIARVTALVTASPPSTPPGGDCRPAAIGTSAVAISELLIGFSAAPMSNGVMNRELKASCGGPLAPAGASTLSPSVAAPTPAVLIVIRHPLAWLSGTPLDRRPIRQAA